VSENGCIGAEVKKCGDLSAAAAKSTASGRDDVVEGDASGQQLYFVLLPLASPIRATGRTKGTLMAEAELPLEVRMANSW